MVQWLGLCTSTAGGIGLIPGQGVKILQVAWYNKKKKKAKNTFGRGEIHGNSVFSAQFCYDSQTVLKKSLFKK